MLPRTVGTHTHAHTHAHTCTQDTYVTRTRCTNPDQRQRKELGSPGAQPPKSGGNARMTGLPHLLLPPSPRTSAGPWGFRRERSPAWQARQHTSTATGRCLSHPSPVLPDEICAHSRVATGLPITSKLEGLILSTVKPGPKKNPPSDSNRRLTWTPFLRFQTPQDSR